MSEIEDLAETVRYDAAITTFKPKARAGKRRKYKVDLNAEMKAVSAYSVRYRKVLRRTGDRVLARAAGREAYAEARRGDHA